MQKSKNIRLIIILATMVTGVLILEFTTKQSDNLSIDKTVFQLDANKEINKVELKGPQQTNQFDFRNGRWHLNDTLLLDQSMRDVFFSVVSQLEVRRPVLKTNSDSIASFLKQSGVRTSISFGEDLIQQYWIGGNSEKQISWAMGEDLEPYQVHIPGYQSYVAGIFNVPTNDWRSRFLLDVNFAMIRTIQVDFNDSRNGLRLNFENNYFVIQGISADSIKIANFLEELAFLQADSYINDVILDQESTVQGSIKLELVNGTSTIIKFFPDDLDKRFLIAELNDGSLAKVDRRRLAGLFKLPEDFE